MKNANSPMALDSEYESEEDIRSLDVDDDSDENIQSLATLDDSLGSTSYQSNLEVTAEQGEFHTANVIIDLATPEFIADLGASDITFETADQGRTEFHTDDVIIHDAISAADDFEGLESCDQNDVGFGGGFGDGTILHVPEREPDTFEVLDSCDHLLATPKLETGYLKLMQIMLLKRRRNFAANIFRRLRWSPLVTATLE